MSKMFEYKKKKLAFVSVWTEIDFYTECKVRISYVEKEHNLEWSVQRMRLKLIVAKTTPYSVELDWINTN